MGFKCKLILLERVLVTIHESNDTHRKHDDLPNSKGEMIRSNQIPWSPFQGRNHVRINEYGSHNDDDKKKASVSLKLNRFSSRNICS